MSAKERKEVKYQILGKGPPSSKLDFHEVVEFKMGEKVVIGQKAMNGMNPYLLVAGFKRSEIMDEGRVKTVLVHQIERDEEPVIKGEVQKLYKLPAIFHR